MVRDDNVYFTCSSRPSKQNTNSDRMQERIEKALLDIRDVFVPVVKKMDESKEAKKVATA